jgi:hypothetical protein
MARNFKDAITVQGVHSATRLVLPPLSGFMARSPAVNALNELADELYNAACFVGNHFTVDSHEVQEVMRRVVRDIQAYLCATF